MRAHVLERRRELALRPNAAARTDHARTRTKAAVDAAAIGHEQERAIRIALDQVARDFVGFFPEWVAQVAAFDLGFRDVRHALDAHRAARVFRVAQAEVVGRDRERKAALERAL